MVGRGWRGRTETEWWMESFPKLMAYLLCFYSILSFYLIGKGKFLFPQIKLLGTLSQKQASTSLATSQAGPEETVSCYKNCLPFISRTR